MIQYGHALLKSSESNDSALLVTQGVVMWKFRRKDDDAVQNDAKFLARLDSTVTFRTGGWILDNQLFWDVAIARFLLSPTLGPRAPPVDMDRTHLAGHREIDCRQSVGL
ncbi:hypothetical protein AXG93_146s1180 [Marchantia polymorpha subsp. ruderalis]|uniref:Uncharacterized protein n=1 Tax=Marchantia polymorpha subsp. ruderalis TaxID=1480154 RepID=A0A176W8R4_MARPO|nr:hypothetical protein AXG93_146s1180 [Marchantia polymorpha subsp. ruderalis]